MTRTEVKSSSITTIGHDPMTQEMDVEFNTGQVYRYANVTREKYFKIVSYPSVGRAFATLIKSDPKAHPLKKISPPTNEKAPAPR